jgi:arylsulfatase A-like enzyme
VWKKAGYQNEDFANLDIELPANYADDLLTKPAVQRPARAAYDLISPLPTDVAQREYVRFYAHLNKLVDGHIVKVLDMLEETGLMDKTIILRIADHGEGGLSHGMREANAVGEIILRRIARKVGEREHNDGEMCSLRRLHKAAAEDVPAACDDQNEKGGDDLPRATRHPRAAWTPPPSPDRLASPKAQASPAMVGRRRASTRGSTRRCS